MNLHFLLEHSIQHNASDLHLAPELKPLLRMNGELIQETSFATLTPEDIQHGVYSLISDAEKDIFEKELSLDFAFEIPSLGRFRVNVFRQIQGVAAVIRILPQTIPTLDDLDIPPAIQSLLNLPQGLILVTGPTGSGKSTTLAAMVDYLNTHKKHHIITIEDPIEFVHPSKHSLISQRQVQRDTHSFSSALRSALREDPNVILIGEMRDLETIRLALTAAETGHLVLATLHTNSAPRAINRIVDVFPSGEKEFIRHLLAESLQAVICQQLAKTVTHERRAIFEVMLATAAVRNSIRENKIPQLYSLIQTGNSVGMCTMMQYQQMLAQRNIVFLEEA